MSELHGYYSPGLVALSVVIAILVSSAALDLTNRVTFASALRSILRQDPDVVFVGEIRDLETAEVAIQASLTGHLVLATLHANDAVGAVARFTDIGVDRAKVATTLRGAVAQRLARRVCPQCAQRVSGSASPDAAPLAARYGTQPV